MEENLKYIAIGLMAFAMLGAALGVSNVFSAFINAVARNPSTESKISKYVYIGAAMVEAIALFGLGVALFMLVS